MTVPLLSKDFNAATDQATFKKKSVKRKAPPPLTVRLTYEERARLERDAQEKYRLVQTQLHQRRALKQRALSLQKDLRTQKQSIDQDKARYVAMKDSARDAAREAFKEKRRQPRQSERPAADPGPEAIMGPGADRNCGALFLWIRLKIV